jgi:hypothetical protein
LEWVTGNIVDGNSVNFYVEVTECFIYARAWVDDGMGGVLAEWSAAQTPYANPGNLDGFECTDGALIVDLEMLRIDDPASSFTLSLTACASICANDWPEIVASIWDAEQDYAGGDVTWGGETWTTAEINNATPVQKILCPTAYALGYSVATTISGLQNKVWTHQWSGSDILLQRFILMTGFTFAPTLCLGHGGGNRLSIENNTDSVIFGGNCVTSWTTTNISQAALGLITTLAGPTTANYQIPNEFFSTIVLGGLTYAWERGLGWP